MATRFVLHSLPVPAVELPVPLLFAVRNNRATECVHFLLVNWQGTLLNSVVVGPLKNPSTVREEEWGADFAEASVFRSHVSFDCSYMVMFATASRKWVNRAYVLPDSRVSYFLNPSQFSPIEHDLKRLHDCSDLRWIISAMRPNPFVCSESIAKPDFGEAVDLTDIHVLSPEEQVALIQSDRQWQRKVANWQNFIVESHELALPRQSVSFADDVFVAVSSMKEHHAKSQSRVHLLEVIDKEFAMPTDMLVAYSASVGRPVPAEHQQKEPSNYEINSYLFNQSLTKRPSDFFNMPCNVVALRFAQFQNAAMIEVSCTLVGKFHKCWLNFDLIQKMANRFSHVKASQCFQQLKYIMHGKADGKKKVIDPESGIIDLENAADFISDEDEPNQVDEADGNDADEQILVIGPDVPDEPSSKQTSASGKTTRRSSQKRPCRKRKE